MDSSTVCFVDKCLSGLRGLHPQLDEVVPVGTAPGPTISTITTISITNNDGRGPSEKQYPQNKNSTNGKSSRESSCDRRRNMVLSLLAPQTVHDCKDLQSQK
ncbi:hypothetical protein Tco_1313517 [Tanacetum coccineum]